MVHKNKRLNIIDLGSYGGFPDPWVSNLSHVNFALCIDAFRVRKKHRIKGFRYIKNTIYKEKCVHNFYILNKSRCSSLYEPNYEFIRDLHGKIPHKYRIKRKQSIECCRLDTILDKIKVKFDFIKSDLQGSDIDAIMSAGKHLNNVVGICTEIYLKPFYKDIILFEEADRLLNNFGFILVKKLKRENNIFNNFLYLKESFNDKNKINLIRKIFEI